MKIGDDVRSNEVSYLLNQSIDEVLKKYDGK